MWGTHWGEGGRGDGRRTDGVGGGETGSVAGSKPCLLPLLPFPLMLVHSHHLASNPITYVPPVPAYPCSFGSLFCGLPCSPHCLPLLCLWQASCPTPAWGTSMSLLWPGPLQQREELGRKWGGSKEAREYNLLGWRGGKAGGNR